MSRLRAAVIVVLLVAPVLVFVGLGAWALWQSGQGVWLWLTLPLCWGTALLLAKWWGGRLIPTRPPAPDIPSYWTPRDEQAWQLVQARMEAADDIDPAEWVTLQFYVETGRQLAEDIARIYHPRAADPLESLTIPEILAALQLALEDLAELWDRYVPGGHWLTVKNWRSLSKLPRRYRFVSHLLTVGSALFSPVAALGRLAVSKTVTAPMARMIQSNMLEWFYVAYLQRLGFYLIEMNSGRLKGGKEKFRAAVARLRTKEKPWERAPDTQPATPTPPESAAPEECEESTAHPSVGKETAVAAAGGISGAASPSTAETKATGTASSESPATGPEETAAEKRNADNADEVTVCLIGQTECGQSRLIAALPGDRPDEPERLRKTSTVKVHRLTLPDSGQRLRLLEPPGYNSFAESRTLRNDRQKAVQQADGLLLLLDASCPSHEADRAFLEAVFAHYEEHPEEKPPPLLVVLTHIDRLAPAKEENPSDRGQQPAEATETETEEKAARQAVEMVRHLVGNRAFDIVPLDSDISPGQSAGVQKLLLPALTDLTEAARAVHSLRQLHEELGRGKMSRVLRQAWNLGKAWWKK